MLLIFQGGTLGNNYPAESLVSVRPTLYLVSDIRIDGGTGEESNPYNLKL